MCVWHVCAWVCGACALCVACDVCARVGVWRVPLPPPPSPAPRSPHLCIWGSAWNRDSGGIRGAPAGPREAALSPRSLGGPSFAGAANALQRGEKLLPVEARQTLRPLGAVRGTQGTLQTGSPFRSQHGSAALLSADVRGPAVSSHTEPPPVAAPRSMSSMVTSPAL